MRPELKLDPNKVAEISKADMETMIERGETMITEGAKALMLLNSAGAGAMLAFAQALAGKADATLFQHFKWFAVVALLTYLTGAFFAAATFLFRAYRVAERVAEGDHEFTAAATGASLILAPTAFIVASLVAVAGIAFAL